MADLGSIALLCAFALSSYSAVGSLLGAWKRLPPLVESARHAVYLAALSLVVATVGLVGAFLAHDFEVSYVAQHSNLAMPRVYTWVAFYAGNEGSLLFIATVLALLCSLAVVWAPTKLKDSMPHATTVMMLVLTFFLAVTTIMANPFDRLDFVPPDGQGINPLLVHFGMFIHPPMLMSGLVAVTIPFSLGAGALLAGKSADEWVDGGRVWGIGAWAVLGIGLLLGSWWAYTILGWGGYWAWDPVENAALMPWLGLTAFIHSIMVQKRRGMFRMWNIALINISFALSLFGMFINRGGPVPSVHSFGASDLGLVFLVFLGIGLVAPFGLFLWRYSSLRSAQNLESSLSREAAFLVNNLMLLGIAFVTMWGVIFPLISEISQGPDHHGGCALLQPGQRTVAAGAHLSHGGGSVPAVAAGHVTESGTKCGGASRGWVGGGGAACGVGSGQGLCVGRFRAVRFRRLWDLHGVGPGHADAKESRGQPSAGFRTHDRWKPSPVWRVRGAPVHRVGGVGRCWVFVLWCAEGHSVGARGAHLH